ncbi:hypothetical protein M2132_000662 [Dysgonomonas sp. PH5-45]|uniref:T9SS type A sorting domain-containing protein n=1 Tax=unclassified Dysgonomonas TaxID=2630389 RepID=UPI0024734E9A|nr:MULTISPECIES: T9SS type A sorting domain-containing protein [unclassified Dysgonomonas]MDH6354334.1 hypothetical protein [Dysgonomonas sp. PH5-45]MDH6387234.1 hypothetical protein [Dysgonomonas sp. PH5-37]
MKKLILLLCLCVSASSYAGTGFLKKNLSNENPVKESAFTKAQKTRNELPVLKTIKADNKFDTKLHLKAEKTTSDLTKYRLDSVSKVTFEGITKEHTEFYYNDRDFLAKQITYEWNTDLSVLNKIQEQEFAYADGDPGYLISQIAYNFTPYGTEGLKTEWIYDENGNEIGWVVSMLDGDNWMPLEKLSGRIFDHFGNITYEEKFMWNGEGWDPSEKFIVEFDEYNNVTLNEFYSWDGADWMGSKYETASYLPDGHQLTYGKKVWSYTTKEWIDDMRFTMTYENGVVTRELTEFWNKTNQDWNGNVPSEWGGDPLYNSDVVLTYNNLSREIHQTHSNLIGDKWIPRTVYETTWTDLTNDSILSVRTCRMVLDIDNPDVLTHTKTLAIKYDSMDREVYMKESSSMTGTNFVSDFEYFYVYDEYGNEVEQKVFGKNGAEDHWNVYTFDTESDNPNRLLEQTSYLGHIDGGWLEFNHFVSQYDSNGERNRKYAFLWAVGDDWAADWGLGDDIDYNVHISDMILPFGYASDYKLLANYNYAGNGSLGKDLANFITADTQTYFYSEHQLLSIDNEDKSITVSVFPNPTAGILNINTPEDVKVSIFNMQGIVMLQTTAKQVDISGFASGVYIVDVNGTKTKVVKK